MEEDIKFIEKLSPIIGGKKYIIPVPDVSPDARRQRRLIFRNERNLYKRKCSLSGKEIISNYSSDKPYKVYDRNLWWSDKFDPLAYGENFDFSRPFFEQFNDLIKETPVFSLSASPDAEEQNCSYVNFASFNKNCYMMFDSDASEQCYYSNVMKHSLWCLDCTYVQHSELCYECIDCTRCYNLFFSEYCFDCSDSAFLKNCIGCKRCIFCTNLRNKEYCIKNKRCTKEEYERVLENLKSRKIVSEMKKEFDNFCLNYPEKESHKINTENSVGDYLSHVKNCFYSFDIAEAEDIRYSDALYRAKDCCDVSSFGEGIEKIYFSGTIGFDVSNVAFSFACRVNCSDMYYCFNCYRSHNCFSCVSLKGHEYCIFNKQYSKQDYEILVGKIIEHMQKTGEWGQFFPASLSPFGYNEAVVQEYFPLTKEQAINQGFKWHDRIEETPKIENIIEAEKLPDDIKAVTDNVLSFAIKCEKSGRCFKIIPTELKFYREHGLPLPHLHPDERHKQRMAKRTPRQLWQRECQNCGNKIFSSYSINRKEKVFCERCYLNAVS